MVGEYTEYLEHAFDVLNKIYFNSALPKAIITVQSSPKSYGYITTSKVWTDKEKEESFYEINISAEHLTRPIENVLATLVHEMIHLFSIENNIKSVSCNGRYHNAHFKEEAERRDLKITYEKYIGWSNTMPTDMFIQKIKENGLYRDIKHSRNTATLGGLPTGKKKSSTRKYVCPNCGASIRATKDINLIHADCEVLMVKVD